MKIAILTQPLGHNYGGIMQAYALQQILHDLGHDIITIDRRRDKHNIIWRGARKIKLVLNFIFGKKAYGKSITEPKTCFFSGTMGFIKKNIVRSELIDSNKKLIKHFNAECYDAVIVGSDQVWRPRYSAKIYNYFLDFKEDINYEIKAISYAASFGVEEWEFNSKQTKRCRGLISSFSAISVRESDGIELCQKYLKVNAEVVLDPTLLLDSNVYVNMCGASDVSGGKGLLTYILDDNKSKSKFIKNIADDMSLSIFTCQLESLSKEYCESFLSELQYPPVVESWIKSFIDADYVITDSFHGCVFAIIFNKPFIAIANSKRGVSRFTSLLSILGLTDRLILECDIDYEANFRDEIDWFDVNERLLNEREKSLLFINKWL